MSIGQSGKIKKLNFLVAAAAAVAGVVVVVAVAVAAVVDVDVSVDGSIGSWARVLLQLLT